MFGSCEVVPVKFTNWRNHIYWYFYTSLLTSILCIFSCVLLYYDFFHTVMVNNSTNINKTNNHLNPLNTMIWRWKSKFLLGTDTKVWRDEWLSCTCKVYRIMLTKHFINSNIVHNLLREWVSDCCLTPIEQFSAISWREQVTCSEWLLLNANWAIFSYIMTRTSYMYIM